MKEKAYEFAFLGGSDSAYIFPTRFGITYEVRFKPSGYLFGDEQPFADSIFEVVLLPARGDADKEKPLDARIPSTVAAIVKDFFIQKETVLLYICEDNDGRGAVRNRKFGQWFNFYKLEYHFKFDFTIGSAEEQYYNSVIGRMDNPYKNEIIAACFELAEDNSK
ncbi:DUF6169 family protein [Salmonirosea aquatica]|uniref:Uncharacterized protein n=1 Tax=Salmonirosea aquatica TaxID=2654236 RepID=A0A7C9BKB0_9BACT|nr:hypothetical protein [Cytophagaceae bacterium SJW1-29]